jgi:WD40 repeat protein
LIRRLGKGAFGEVWLAGDVDLGRKVALKLPRYPSIEPSLLLFEAKTAASLRHPNIVTVYQVGSVDGQVFIASEFIDGQTLHDRLSAGKPTVQTAVSLLAVIARALHHAHEHGIVHRDVKPGNILLNRENQPFVTDFGIAKHISPESTVQFDGQIVGTARYMSPEQASGLTEETDHRSDIYALGVMLFEMLTGEVPFRGTMRAVLHQKMFEEPPSPRLLDSSVPKDLETICLKCLERHRENRYGSALEVAEEMERFANNEPILARPISRAERAWRWCRKRPAITGLAVGLVSSLTIGLIGVSYFWLQASRSADSAMRSLYRARMNLVAGHLANGNISAVREILAQVTADSTLATHRGFETGYYQNITAPLVAVANHGNAITDVAVSRDADLCASIGSGSEVRIWNSGTGQLVHTVKVEAERVDAIEFSPTSLILATGSVDGFVRLWNIGQEVRMTFQIEHGPQVQLVRFSPDGKLVLAAGKLGAVRVWDHGNSRLVAEIPAGRESEIRDVRFLGDSQRVAVALRNGLVRVWSIAPQGAPLKPGTRRQISEELEAFAVSDDGQLFVSGDYHGTVTVSPAAGDEGRSVETNWGRIDDIEFLKGTHFAAIVANDGELHLFDADQQREFRTIHTHGLSAGTIARSGNGSSLVAGSGNGAISLIEIDSAKSAEILWHSAPVRRVEFLSNNSRIAAVDQQGVLQVWDLATGKATQLDPGQDKPAAWTISAQSTGSLVVRGGPGPTVDVWDADTRKKVHAIEASPAGTAALRFSTTGELLAIAPRQKGIRVYRSAKWEKPVVETSAEEDPVLAMAWSPDDRYLAVIREKGPIALFQPVVNPNTVAHIELPSVPSSVVFCGNGNELAIGTDDGEIHIWDLASQKFTQLIRAHFGRINAMATFPDSGCLVSGGRDRTLNLWDIRSGELITPLAGHFRQVFAIAVSPDGRTIVSGGLEGDLRIWRSGTANQARIDPVTAVDDRKNP